MFPNDGNGPCYACLYDDEDEWLGNCQGNGVLAPVPGVIGTLMAEEALLHARHRSARSRPNSDLHFRFFLP